MSKAKINLFKKSEHIENEGKRHSDIGFVEGLRIKESQENKKAEPAKSSAKPKRTTATISEEHQKLMDDMLYTIRSSGKNKLIEAGDFSFRNQDFWEMAIEAFKEKVEATYGKIKSKK